ncbi:MAG: DnaJ domain-containing protein [Desulfobacula sp.]|nr:DnaJ domain-containing protein [Desulfobacula sp.]
MNLYLKIILILFGLAYLISPVDIIPELFVPYIGWIDDGFVLFAIVHLIRYGELPWFLFKKKSPFTNNSGRKKNQVPPGQKEQNNSGREKTRGSENTAETENPKSAYEILGISPNASSREIHEAYKKKIKQYHPDKLSHLGEEFSNLANEKFLEIQNAYDTLKTKASHS